MKLVNLTPHPIAIYASGDDWTAEPVAVIAPSGTVARIVDIDLGWGEGPYDGGSFPITHREYGRLEGVPPREEGTQYIVSLVAALAAQGRDDLLAPFGEVRNDSGTMVGCRALQRVC